MKRYIFNNNDNILNASRCILISSYSACKSIKSKSISISFLHIIILYIKWNTKHIIYTLIKYNLNKF